MRPSCRLVLEQLEDRLTPSTTGFPWPNGAHLTLSFAPDGTNIGGSPSCLFQLLSSTGQSGSLSPMVQSNSASPPGQNIWQSIVMRAVETWESAANLNIQVVSDGGQPFGCAGALQGDSRFGDLRIGAAPLSSNLASLGIPFSPWAGTWSGDIILNSNDTFGTNGAGQYDFYTDILHELGHSFGLNDNTTDPSSVMYATYTGAKTGLDAQDVSDIQSLYGPPSFQSSSWSPTPAGNVVSIANSVNVAITTGTSFNYMHFDAYGALNASVNAGFFRISVPAGSWQGVAAMIWGTSGSSGFQPVIQLFNSSFAPVPTQVVANGSGTYAVQASAPTTSTLYLVVFPASGNSAGSNYFLDVTLETVLPTWTALTNGTLNATSSASGTMTINSTCLFDFGLSASTQQGNTQAYVTMSLTDGQGNTWATMTALDSQGTVTTTAFLQPGTYYVSYQEGTTNGSPLPAINYYLAAQVLAEPLGAYTVSGSDPLAALIYAVGSVVSTIPACC